MQRANVLLLYFFFLFVYASLPLYLSLSVCVAAKREFLFHSVPTIFTSIETWHSTIKFRFDSNMSLTILFRFCSAHFGQCISFVRVEKFLSVIGDIVHFCISPRVPIYSKFLFTCAFFRTHWFTCISITVCYYMMLSILLYFFM